MDNKLFKLIYGFGKKVGSDNIGAYAAQSAFFIIMSMVPFLSILLAMVKFLPIDQETIVYAIQSFVPAPLDPLVNSIFTELFTRSSKTYVSFSFIILIWPSAKGTYAIVKGLDKIYNEDNKVNFINLILVSILYTLLFVFVIIATLLLLVFGGKIKMQIEKHSPWLGGFIGVFLKQKFLISFVILTLFFVLVYKLVKRNYSSFLTLIPGAFISSATWIGFSILYSIYINKFSNFAYTYGSLATIVLLMLWLYFGMYFMFIGAEINSFFQAFIEKIRTKAREKSQRRREKKLQNKKRKEENTQVKQIQEKNV